jgi:hypothetical protein
MKSLVYLLALAILTALALQNFRKIAGQTTDFDRLKILVNPLLPALNGSSMIGYKSECHTELLFTNLQFVFAPIILDRYNHHDTLILVRSLNNCSDTTINPADFSILDSSADAQWKIYLLTVRE